MDLDRGFRGTVGRGDFDVAGQGAIEFVDRHAHVLGELELAVFHRQFGVDTAIREVAAVLLLEHLQRAARILGGTAAGHARIGFAQLDPEEGRDGIAQLIFVGGEQGQVFDREIVVAVIPGADLGEGGVVDPRVLAAGIVDFLSGGSPGGSQEQGGEQKLLHNDTPKRL